MPPNHGSTAIWRQECAVPAQHVRVKMCASMCHARCLSVPSQRTREDVCLDVTR